VGEDDIIRNARNVLAFGQMVKAWRCFNMGILSQKKCGVYRITNLVNGMVYVGQSRDIERRWKEHKKESGREHNYYLYNAIRKYGIENFSFSIILECSMDELDFYEKKFITDFDSLKPNGYNLEGGGNSLKVMADETKEKISLSKRLLGQTKRGEEIRKIISDSNSKPVNQYSLDGKYIQTFSSIRNACEDIGIDLNSSHINECIAGIVRQAYGYLWKFAKDGKGNISPMRDRIVNESTAEKIKMPVSQFSLDGEHIATHASGKEASENVGILRSCISSCINGKRKTAGGFLWRRAK